MSGPNTTTLRGPAQSSLQVSHTPNTHTYVAAVNTPKINTPQVNTDDPQVRGILIGAGAAATAGALAFGLYNLYQYYTVKYQQYKLSYFNLRGLAETSRYLFALKGDDYIDYRYPEVPVPGDATKVKRPLFEANKESLPFGQVPTLQIGGDKGLVLSQSRAIDRYLAKQFGYMGSSAIEEQLIDSVGEAIRDLRDTYFKAKDNPEEKAKFWSDNLPRACRYLNRFATNHGTSSDHNTFVGSGITLADVQFYHFLSLFDDQDSVTKTLAPYPTLKAIRKNFGDQPQIQEWIAKRPVTSS